MSVLLPELIAFCDQRTHQKEIKHFDGAYNGLQLENNGTVTKIAAAVDAGQLPFEAAILAGVDFIICHHGLYWNAPITLTGTSYMKIKTAIDGNLAVYGAHLPLDGHPEIGNNALLADLLGLKKKSTPSSTIKLPTRPLRRSSHARVRPSQLSQDRHKPNKPSKPWPICSKPASTSTPSAAKSEFKAKTPNPTRRSCFN